MFVRHVFGAMPERQAFRERIAYATSNPDETPDDLPVGETRDVCVGLDLPAAATAVRVAGRASCFEQRVAIDSGQKVWEGQSALRWEIRIGNVVASTEDPGKLEVTYTDRIDIGTGEVVECSGGALGCWQRGSEPGGEETAFEDVAAWSPDGTKLAFLRDPDGILTTFNEEIWIADLTTREIRRVMTAERGDPGVPLWTPDGRWLVFGMALGERLVEPPNAPAYVATQAIDVHALRIDDVVSLPPIRLTIGLRPFSIGLSAPLTLPSAP